MKISKKMSFTKWIVFAVMVCFLWGVALGSHIAIIDHQYISDLLTYLGITTPAVIAFYIWKAKNENLSKFKNWKENNISE